MGFKTSKRLPVPTAPAKDLLNMLITAVFLVARTSRASLSGRCGLTLALALDVIEEGASKDPGAALRQSRHPKALLVDELVNTLARDAQE